MLQPWREWSSPEAMASFCRLLDSLAVMEKLKECLLDLDSLDEEMQEISKMQAEDNRRDAFNFDPKESLSGGS